MSEANDDKWEMPDPVFRSTTGSLPKSFEETISQSFSPDTDTVEIAEDDDILGIMDPPISVPADKVVDNDIEQNDLEAKASPENAVRAKAVVPPPKPSGMPVAVIILLIALVAGVLVAALYFLDRAPSDPTFQ